MSARSLGPIAGLILACAACAPLAQTPRGSEAARAPAPSVPSAPSAPSAETLLSKLPLSFVENRGQADPRVSHYVQGADSSVYFTDSGLTFSLADRRGTAARWAAKLHFVGARARPTATGRTETTLSYFKGDPKEWRTGLPTYSGLTYRELWPGIDLAWSGDASRLKYELRLRPGADAGDIALAYRGAELSLQQNGQLLISTPAGSFTDDRPVAWQLVGAERVPVDVSFELRGDTYGFRVGGHDPRRPLVIDPAIVVYAGFVGGSGYDIPYDVAVDGAGAAYIAGETVSTEATFPEAVGPDLSYNGGATDAFVAKVVPSGASLAYAGFIGGSGSDSANGVAVDASGAAYLTGDTDSTEATFPVAIGPDLTANGGLLGDAFVAKIAPSGASLSYAGFIGGSDSDGADSVAVDSTGAGYIAGTTTSGDFPVAVGPDLSRGGAIDAFVAKVAPSGASLTYAGYIGGFGDEFFPSVAVDASGAAYVTGDTDSTEATFPVMVGPDLSYNGGTNDAFVAKVVPSGASLAYAGFIGGSVEDYGDDVAVDDSGAAYVAGTTKSTEATFPVSVGPDLSSNGGNDVFVAKVVPSGASLSYAGFIGGSGSDKDVAVAVDTSGAAYVVGETGSTQATFPVTVGPDLSSNGGDDAFVAKVVPSGASLAYAGFLGGSDGDYAYGVAVDASGAAYVAGYTYSTEATFPVTVGPDLSYNGNGDGFVAKLTDNLCLGVGVTIQGTAGGETITGTPGADVIKGLGGNDRIDGAGGNDVICAGDGNDTVIGGAGDDKLDGEAGTDTASFPGATPVSASLASGTASGLGADILSAIENLTGSAGKDTLTGNASDNVLKGGDGDDTAFGGDGDDELQGEVGKDRLVGQAGGDLLVGGAKADRLSGGGGKDRLRGQGGKDRLSGGGANDRLAGGKGNDRLNGGKGKKDRCNGGKGKKDTATRCEKVTGVP